MDLHEYKEYIYGKILARIEEVQKEKKATQRRIDETKETPTGILEKLDK